MTIRDIKNKYGIVTDFDEYFFLNCLLIFDETNSYDEFLERLKELVDSDEINQKDFESIEWFADVYSDLVFWEESKCN